MREPSKWARWMWPGGLGRWHAIVGTAGDVTTLACGRTRKPPAVTAGRPGDEVCCPTCRKFDDLRSAYTTERDVTPAPAKVLVTAAPAAPAADDLRVLAQRALPCECPRCATPESKAEREAILAARAMVADLNRRGFEAYLREKEGAR